MLELLGWLRSQDGYTAFDYARMAVVELNAPTTCQQIDSVSCGVFTFAYAYWFAFPQQTMPTTAQLHENDTHVIFRLALIDLFCVSGILSPPLRHLPLAAP